MPSFSKTWAVSTGAVFDAFLVNPPPQKIQAFYPPGSLEQLAARIAQSGALPRIAAQWNIPMEIAMDLAKLALFDTVMLVDDSGSMGELGLRRRLRLGESWVEFSSVLPLSPTQLSTGRNLTPQLSPQPSRRTVRASTTQS